MSPNDPTEQNQQQPQGGEAANQQAGDTVNDATGLSAAEQAQFDAMVGGAEGTAGTADAAAGATGGAAADAGTQQQGGAQQQGQAGQQAQAGQQQAGKKVDAAAGVQPGADAADGDDDDDADGDGAQQGQAAGQQAGQDGGQQKAPPRRVSYGKFARVEKRAKEAEGLLEQGKIERARLEERLTLINEALATPPGQKGQPGGQQGQAGQQQQQNDPRPDPEADIFAYVAWQERQMERLNGTISQMQGGQQRQQQDGEVADLYRTSAEAFAQTEPNFVPAYSFLMESRTFELAQYLFGKDLSEEGAQLTPQEQNEINRAVVAEERNLVTTALKQKRDPAMAIFKMARARGFRPQATAGQPGGQQQQSGQQQNGGQQAGQQQAQPGTPQAGQAGGAQQQNGQGKPAQQAGGQQSNVTEEIARIRNGQDASMSLSNAGGAPQGDAMTVEKLLKMPDEDFGALLDGLSEKQFERIAGG